MRSQRHVRGGRLYSLPEFPEYASKVGGCVMSIEAARIGEHVELCCSNSVRLSSEDSAGLIECQPIGADAKDCQYSRLIKLDFGTQLLSTLREFVGAQLGCRYSRAVYQIGNAIAKGQ